MICFLSRSSQTSGRGGSSGVSVEMCTEMYVGLIDCVAKKQPEVNESHVTSHLTSATFSLVGIYGRWTGPPMKFIVSCLQLSAKISGQSTDWAKAWRHVFWGHQKQQQSNNFRKVFFCPRHILSNPPFFNDTTR